MKKSNSTPKFTGHVLSAMKTRQFTKKEIEILFNLGEIAPSNNNKYIKLIIYKEQISRLKKLYYRWKYSKDLYLKNTKKISR